MIGGFDYLSGGAEENWTLDLLNAILRHHAPNLTQPIKSGYYMYIFRPFWYISIQFCISQSDFMGKDFKHFLILNAQVSHGETRGWMVEPFADQLKTHSKFCPLNVSEGFSKWMCTIIAFKVYGFAPLLNHAVYGHNRERLLVASSGLE